MCLYQCRILIDSLWFLKKKANKTPRQFFLIINFTHNCAWHADDAADLVPPVTFHQKPSSHLHGFRGSHHRVKEQISAHPQLVSTGYRRSGDTAKRAHHGGQVDGMLGWNGSVCLAEELLYVALDAAREEPPAVALEGDPVGADEELLKVPGHIVPADRTPDDELGVRQQGGGVIGRERELFPQELEEGVGILPIHIHLLKELKLGLESISRADVFQRQQDFLILTVLLQRLTLKRFEKNYPVQHVLLS